MISTQCEQLHPDWERLSTLAWSETMHKLPSSSEMCTHVVVWSYTYIVILLYSKVCIIYAKFSKKDRDRNCYTVVAQFLDSVFDHYNIQLHKWIRDRSTFSSYKPKLDIRLFVDFCVFPCSYLFWAENCFVLIFKTIFCSKQVRTGRNTKINKQSEVKFWLNWIKCGSVSYSFSCVKNEKIHYRYYNRLIEEEET